MRTGALRRLGVGRGRLPEDEAAGTQGSTMVSDLEGLGWGQDSTP